MVKNIAALGRSDEIGGTLEFRGAATMPAFEPSRQLFSELQSPGLVMLSGPRGSGKSHALSELSERLTAHGTRHTFAEQHAAPALAALEQLGPGDVFILDGAESASPSVLATVFGQITNGARGLFSLNTEHGSRGYSSSFDELVTRHPWIAAPLAEARAFRLAPLTRARSLEIIESSPLELIDAVTADAVIELSWGRPGWLKDLLTLVEADKILTDPYPAIAALDISDLHLPAIGHLTHTATSGLTRDESVAAIVLSGLEPRTLGSAVRLVGQATVASLRDARVLIPLPNDLQRFAVPELYAAVLRQRDDLFSSSHIAESVAMRLLSQEAIGVPLPPREAMFCARTLTEPPGGTELRAQREAHEHLTTGVTAALLAFASPDAGDVILHASPIEQLSPLDRARAATVLQGPLAGIRTLTKSQATPADTRPETGPPYCSEIEEEFLKQLLLAETSASEQRRALGAATSPIQRAQWLFQLWNETTDLCAEDLPSLLDIAGDSSLPVLAMLAEQLIALDNASFGYRTRSFSPLQAERGERLAVLALTSTSVWDDSLATAAISEAIIALLTGDVQEAPAETATLISRLPGAAFHALWQRHLHATFTAVAAGNLIQAAREWACFSRRLPRFLPNRLRRIVADIQAELDEPGSTPPEQRVVSHHLLAYFRGAFNGITFAAGPAAHHTGGARSEVIGLAEIHVQAALTQNPNALVKVAEQLYSRQLWAPAAYAFESARGIFLRRRASGSATRCAERLRALEATAQQQLPSFSLSALSPAPVTTLSDRELAASSLVATGLSNRQVAEEMQCSVRTVESHIASARAKLGAVTRAELGERMREIGLA